MLELKEKLIHRGIIINIPSKSGNEINILLTTLS